MPNAIIGMDTGIQEVKVREDASRQTADSTRNNAHYSSDQFLLRRNWHHELTAEERALITDSGEHPLFEVIDGMSRLEQESIGVIFGSSDGGHYLRLQLGWYKKEKELLEQRRGKKLDNDDDFSKDLVDHGTPLRFKLWYMAMFPEKVILKGGKEGVAISRSLYPNLDFNECLDMAEDYFTYVSMCRKMAEAA